MGLFTRKDWRDAYRRLPEGDLLERIRSGHQQAEEYLMETYSPIVVKHMQTQLHNKPPQLGEAGDYAHDATLLFLDKVRYQGTSVLKHEYSTIGGWLKQAATNFLLANIRRDKRNDRDQLQYEEENDHRPQAVVDTLEDEGAATFAEMPEKDRDQVLRDVLATQSEELQRLIQLKFMDGFSWKEAAGLMQHLYPDHDPPFALDYLQKTYWDRVHKKPFHKKLLDALKGYGYDS